MVGHALMCRSQHFLLHWTVYYIGHLCLVGLQCALLFINYFVMQSIGYSSVNSSASQHLLLGVDNMKHGPHVESFTVRKL